MAGYRNWNLRTAWTGKAALMVLGFGLVLGVLGSRGSVAVTPESATPPDAAPAAAPDPGKSDGNRIAKGLQKKMEGLGADAALKVIVTMAKGKGVAQAQAAAGAFTVHRQFSIINAFAATMTRAQIEALSRAPGVVGIYEDMEVKAHRADAMVNYGVTDVKTNSKSELENAYDGTGIGICIIDTGIMATHAEFAGGKVKGFCNALTGQCGAGGATDHTPFDDYGHGTHVASIAAGNNGVAPGADLWGAKVLNSAGSGISSDIIAGIDWCMAQPGVHVLNLSLGSLGPSDGTDPLGASANAAAVSKVVVLSAGNSGPAQLQIGTPAAAENPITVGAVADWKSPVGPWRKGLAVFSSRGPTSDSRIKPDILAPGVDINGAWNNGGLVNASGTSMSAPFTAGVAALMLDANMGLLTAPEGASAAVKAILANTAVPRGDVSTLVDGHPKNYDYGWGELDAYAAVAEAEGASPYSPTPFPVELYANPTIADGTVWDYEFEVTDPNTKISAVVTNGGVWTAIYLSNEWWTLQMGQDFDAQLHAPIGTPGGTLVDESTCEIDADTQCGTTGRQETLVADPADFPGGVLPTGTWRVIVEPWNDTDGLPEEIIDLTVLLGPVGGGVVPVPQGTIDGTVTDGTPGAPSNGNPIGGALITADTGENTTTDASGSYSLMVPAGERSVTVTAAGFDPAVHNNITVADGATVTEDVALIDANDPPSFLSDPIVGAPAEAGTAYVGSIAGTATDPDFGAVLNYSKVSGPVWLVVASNGALSGTPTGTDVGPNSFQVGVNDGNGGSDQTELTIEVAAAPAPNNPPIFTADPMTGAPGTEGVAYSETLAGSATDTDGDPLTYAKDSGPAWLSVAGNGGLTGTPGSGDVGANAFTVSVSDGNGGSDQAVLNIDVAAAPPAASLHIGDLDGTAGSSGKNWFATVTALVRDNLNQPVVGAKVNGMWTGDSSGLGDCTTAVNGTCAITSGDIPKKQTNATIFTVTGVVVPAGYTYESGDNSDPDGDSSGTAIQVNKDGTTSNPGAPPPPATTGSVSGTVNSAGGVTIGGATVTADTGQSTTTDGSGIYTLTDVPTGSRIITASASGYDSADQGVPVSENTTTALNFTLAESGGEPINCKKKANRHLPECN